MTFGYLGETLPCCTAARFPGREMSGDLAREAIVGLIVA